MLLTYGCLLVLVSSSFAFPDPLPWYSNHITRPSTRGNDQAVSNGFEFAHIEDYPYIASIVYETAKGPVAAGAIINKNWILSNALLSLVNASQLNIFVGTNFAGRSGQRLNLTKIITHEKYDQSYTFWYNIALLKTEEPITFSDAVKPVQLGKSVPRPGTNCTLLGYGFLKDRPFTAAVLGEATIKVKSPAPCTREYGALKTSFCAGAKGVDLCTGDLGDLLMYKNQLVGFYIFGDICYPGHYNQVFTKVPHFKKWIWKTIKDNSNDDEMEGLSVDQFE